MAEPNISNIKLSDADLHQAIDFYCKSLQRQINTTSDKEIQEIYERKLSKFRQALMTINQLELLPQTQQRK